MSLRALASTLTVALLGCGPEPMPAPSGCHEQPLRWTGDAGALLPARVELGVFDVPVTVGGTAGRAILDTGAPLSIIDPTAFPSERFAQGHAAGPDLSLGEVRLTGPKVLAVATGAQVGGDPVTVLVGADLLCHFEATFDYRDAAVQLSAPAAPRDVQAALELPVDIRGGGVGQVQLSGTTTVVQFPPTRALVTVTLDGAPRRLVLDTGASMTVLSKSAFDALVADGRRTLAGASASTVMGVQDVLLTRVRTLKLGELELSGTIVSRLDGALWGALSQETGQQIDGLLGGTTLREALLTVSYPQKKVTLRRYGSRAHVRDELVRVGASVGPLSSGGYAISSVFPGSDAAAKGLTVGTQLLSVDGQDLASLRQPEVDLLLRGTAGATKTLRTPAGTLSVRVEDLLPL